MEVVRLIDRITNWVYYCTLFVAVIYSILRFKKLDKGGKYICAFIWLGLLYESIGWTAAVEFKNNLPVYAIGNILELGLISLYFNSAVRKLKKHNIGIVIAISGATLGIINMVFLQPINKLNSNFVFLECVVVVCLCLFSIFQMLIITDEKVELKREFHFWIACTLLFYQCASLGNWGILGYITEFLPDKLIFWDIAIVLINMITYLSLIILLYYYPKLMRTDV